jgi:hypothetical protein
MKIRSLVSYVIAVAGIGPGLGVQSLHARLIEASELEEPRAPMALVDTDLNPIEGVLMEGGQVFHIQAGIKTLITKPLQLSSGLEVRENGVVLLDARAVWNLEAGQLLGKDGTVLHPDGRVVYAEEHYLCRKGRIYHVLQGVDSLVDSEIVLPNGARIGVDNRMHLPSGKITYILDGQVLRRDGSELQAWDSVSIRNGKVVFYKDGSLLTLPSQSGTMMSEGTFVWGDGRITRRTKASGWSQFTVALAEGMVMKLDGAINEGRLYGSPRQRR